MWLLSGHAIFGRPDYDPASMLVLRDVAGSVLIAFSNYPLRDPVPEADGWLAPFVVTQTSNSDGCSITQSVGLACEPFRSDDVTVAVDGEELLLTEGQSGLLAGVRVWASQARTGEICGADGTYEPTHFGMAANDLLTPT